MRIVIAAVLGLLFFMLLMGGWVFWVDLLPPTVKTANVRCLAPAVAIALIIAGIKLVAKESRKTKEKTISNQEPK